MHSKNQRQGDLSFAESLWRRNLMQNLGLDHPRSVENGVDLISSERRNATENNTNTLRHGSQAGKEELDVARNPTGALLVMQKGSGDAVNRNVTSGHGHRT
ncbi:hypothetical protein AHAS_Ahas17G0109000 [Arachis hypogaea]